MGYVAVVVGPLERRRTSGAAEAGAHDLAALVKAVTSAAARCELDETILVVANGKDASKLSDDVSVLVDNASDVAEATAVRVAADYGARIGHDGLLVVSAAQVRDPNVAARAVVELMTLSPDRPIAVGELDGSFCGVVRIDAEAIPLLPLSGSLEQLWQAHPSRSTHVAIDPQDAPRRDDAQPSADLEAVTRLLGRVPSSKFEVVVRDEQGVPVVIENAPFLDDGTPMPTRYWLVGERERRAVGRLEAAGGNQAAEAAVDAEAIAACHERYGAARDARIGEGRKGPRPSGGVGGTRTGVKCLHAHLAHYLAGGDDPVGRWVAGQLGDELPGPVAAIDCGTNSTRLLILDRSGDTVSRKMIITRLGEDVDRTGALAKAAIERTVLAARDFRAEMDRHGVVAVRAVATSAARDATNKDEFFDAMQDALGVRPDLLEGKAEGALSYAGATAGLAPGDGPYLVVDLGGGSTELVAGRGGEQPPVVRSLPVGCVRVTERFLSSDPPSADELRRAGEQVAEVLRETFDEVPELLMAPRMVGVAGTVAALVVLDADEDHYDGKRCHHRVLARQSVERLLDVLAKEPLSQRREHRGLEPQRADVIVGGALVLAEVMAATGHDELVYSEKDILDGVAQELFDRRRGR